MKNRNNTKTKQRTNQRRLTTKTQTTNERNQMKT